MNSPDPTLGAELERLDSARFAGRESELERLDGLLRAAGDRPRVVFLHGPGGIGKSALLRQLARRAAELGHGLHWIEGRDLPPVPDALDDALAEARRSERPLVVLDTFERMSGLGGYLRAAVLPALPSNAMVVISGRHPPDPAWHEGGWENVVTELRLRPVPAADARAILERNGFAGGNVEAVVRWARGLPLALTLAARGSARPESRDPGLDEPDAGELIIRRIAATELDHAHSETLAVASIARVTTVAMLAEVIPDSVAADEHAWLEHLTFAEPLGAGVALHELVAELLHEQLRAATPERERGLRVRIADHLYRRARSGEILLSIDLAHLAENPAIRWGYSWEMPATFRVDDVRPSDIEVIEAFLVHTGRPQAWPLTERYMRETPEHVVVVRDSADTLRGYAIAFTPEGAPDLTRQDPLVGPRLAHARQHRRTNALIASDVYDVAGTPEESPIPILGMSTVLRAVRGNPRYAYLPINPEFPGAQEFAAALGAEHLAELDAMRDGELIECHVVDYGPGGLLAAQREVVYLEAGATPPPRDEEATDLHDAVRQALRDLRVPQRLASNPLAEGSGISERAEHVRTLIERGVRECFGEGAGEELLRDVLVRGYIEPAPSHEAAADELALSRSAYFRRLKIASERLADFIAG